MSSSIQKICVRQPYLLLDQLHLHERVPILRRGTFFRRIEIQCKDIAVARCGRTALALRVKARHPQRRAISHWVMSLCVGEEERVYRGWS